MKETTLNSTFNNLLESGLLTTKQHGNVVFVDPFEITKNIKQISELINQVKKYKQKKTKITLLVSSRFLKTTIQQFMKKANINSSINVVHTLNDVEPSGILFICQDFSDKNLNFVLKKFFNKKILIFCAVSTKENMHYNANGCFPMFIENKEIRKMFFLVTLLDKLI